MTGAGSSAPDFRLPPHPRDAHLSAAAAMLRRLAAAFPRAGLGITGSLGTGTHGPGSDVDLVMADASFRRDMQFATRSEGVPTAIVCLRPHFDAAREQRWRLASGSDTLIVSMVRSAFVVRDPEGALEGMQHTVARLDGERLSRRDELAAVRREDALGLVRALHGGSSASDEQLQLRLLEAVVDGWYLREGLAMDTRQASERMLETIAGRDAALHALLLRCVPLTQGSMSALLLAVDHVFAP